MNKSIQAYVEFPYRDPAGIRQLFGYFADEKWAMLLDSGKTIHKAAKFDLIFARPKAYISYSNDKSYLNGFDFSLSHNPFEDLRTFYQSGLKNYAPLPQELSHIPFHGGIAGYCSYDLGRSIEEIPEVAEVDIHLPEMAFGLYEWAFISDHAHQKSYLLQFNAMEESTWASLIEEFKQYASAKQTASYPSFTLTSPWQSNMDEQTYKAKFKQVHEYIHAGDCYQVNLAQRFSAEFNGHAWDAYLELTEHNQAPFSAYMNLGQQQILSLSPERFIQIKQQDGKSHVVTQPIKGTRPRSKDPLEDKAFSDELLSSEKDRAENLMIVDLLRNDIGRTAEYGSVTVSKLFELQSFISVHHLVSTVEADLAEDKDAFDLLENCFPGGSITGAPKIRAMEIIEELEPHRRSIYCGSFMYLDYRGILDSSITIRTLVTEDGLIHTWGGGGLVADSEAASEYQETYHKLSRILPILAGKH
ncbi:aminodeoxychorismate synthase component I [Kangiella sp. HZ709]|uniref:aminodeoxychorismate synthase component I n=1 Tax=Kangiella sp. HZ709 TaxID=2666328 RepID=UPI0012AF1D66|nr:aminodeoxychorismate synthase component I [Kangiella sp. HZ709]MRX26580.1 aminodeoxychorismate synthase component I [Kangiella sp. HZ709]